MTFKKYIRETQYIPGRKKRKKPCQICGEISEMRNAQLYCRACAVAVSNIHVVRNARERKKAWGALSQEEQLKRMDLASHKFLDDPEIKIRHRKNEK